MSTASSTAEQRSIVTLALLAESRADALSDMEAQHNATLAELVDARKHALTLLGGGRVPRPYEGSLWRELRHAVLRWRAMR